METEQALEHLQRASLALDEAVTIANTAGWAFEHPAVMRRLGDLAIDVARLWLDLTDPQGPFPVPSSSVSHQAGGDESSGESVPAQAFRLGQPARLRHWLLTGEG